MRHFCALAILSLLPMSLAAEGISITQRAIEEAQYTEAESALLLELDKDPKNDEIRFGLGVVQFLGAVEGLGQALYEYGAISNKSRQPFLRLSVPKNENPAELSYQEFGRVLDEFATGLRRSEATLADITDDEVKLQLELAKLTFDFTATGENRSSLTGLVTTFNASLPKQNPELKICFDRGDVAWLRSYCHLLCAMVEGYNAIDVEDGFNERVGQVFPNTRETKEPAPNWYKYLIIADPPRLRRMRLHLAAVGALNRETWAHIRKETDDHFEWLPHPKQTDQLNLPMTDAQIDTWLNFMANVEGLMTGEKLLSYDIVRIFDQKVPKDKGLSLRKLLDAPPRDLFNWERLNEKGIEERYLEDQAGKEVFDFSAIFGVLQLFNGPFGFARAVRMN
ncbi:MAG: hypothetical protein AAFU85_00500 [Planctomycetota bacterium]